MSLLNILLNQERSKGVELRERPVHHRMDRPPVRRSLIETLRESHEREQSVTLRPSEVRQLLRIIENKSFRDPFETDKSVLDDGDLKSLGLKTNGEGEKYGLRDTKDFPKENGEKDKGDLVNKQPIFGPESALVAPDCTPGGRDDIPRSVLHSMKILSGEEAEKEYNPGHKEQRVEEPQQPEVVRQTIGSPREPQPREPQPRVQPQESAISILKVTKTLREGSKKQNSRRVIKKALTEEQRSAISALSGPAD